MQCGEQQLKQTQSRGAGAEADAMWGAAAEADAMWGAAAEADAMWGAAAEADAIAESSRCNCGKQLPGTGLQS